MRFKKCFVLLIAAFLVLVLGGCGVPRTGVPPNDPPRQVEQPPVDAVVDPVVEVPNNEFRATKRKLIERGILKDTTPVYRVDEAVDAGEFRYALGYFSLSKYQIIVTLEFFGAEGRDEIGSIMDFRTRVIIDDKEYLSSKVALRSTKDGPTMSSYFPRRGILEHSYILVFIRSRVSPEEVTQRRPESRRLEAREGEVAVILMPEDMVIER